MSPPWQISNHFLLFPPSSIGTCAKDRRYNKNLSTPLTSKLYHLLVLQYFPCMFASKSSSFGRHFLRTVTLTTKTTNLRNQLIDHEPKNTLYQNGSRQNNTKKIQRSERGSFFPNKTFKITIKFFPRIRNHHHYNDPQTRLPLSIAHCEIENANEDAVCGFPWLCCSAQI